MNLADPKLDHRAVIEALGLAPHPEGGHFREVWRDAPADGARGAVTAIHYLLGPGEDSHWHRVDAAELWLWQGGGALSLRVSPDGREEEEILLGPDLSRGQCLMALVPKGAWQAARPLGGWVLVACTVSPAFEFAGFEMAPPGWAPG
nr:cupin domain-containing protein [Sabulicella rubraurantiaca]